MGTEGPAETKVSMGTERSAGTKRSMGTEQKERMVLLEPAVGNGQMIPKESGDTEQEAVDYEK